MKYNKAVILKNNKECLIRNAKKEDAKGVLENFALTLEETDYMRSLKDENKLSLEMEIELLSKKARACLYEAVTWLGLANKYWLC